MGISKGLKQKVFYLLSTDFTQTQKFVNPVQSSFWVMTMLHIKAEKEMSERSFYHCYSIWKARVNIHPWLSYLHYRFITACIPVCVRVVRLCTAWTNIAWGRQRISYYCYLYKLATAKRVHFSKLSEIWRQPPLGVASCLHACLVAMWVFLGS